MVKKPLLKVGDSVIYKGRKTTILRVDPGSDRYHYALKLPNHETFGWWVDTIYISPVTKIRRP